MEISIFIFTIIIFATVLGMDDRLKKIERTLNIASRETEKKELSISLQKLKGHHVTLRLKNHYVNWLFNSFHFQDNLPVKIVNMDEDWIHINYVDQNDQEYEAILSLESILSVKQFAD